MAFGSPRKYTCHWNTNKMSEYKHISKSLRYREDKKDFEIDRWRRKKVRSRYSRASSFECTWWRTFEIISKFDNRPRSSRVFNVEQGRTFGRFEFIVHSNIRLYFRSHCQTSCSEDSESYDNGKYFVDTCLRQVINIICHQHQLFITYESWIFKNPLANYRWRIADIIICTKIEMFESEWMRTNNTDRIAIFDSTSESYNTLD